MRTIRRSPYANRFVAIAVLVAVVIIGVAELSRLTPFADITRAEAAGFSDAQDFSVSYSTGRFKFARFQSLIFTERGVKDLLTVMPRQGRVARFIKLDPVREQGRLTRPWAIGAGLTTNPGVARDYPRIASSKHLPRNAIKATYTDEMIQSDVMLASVFGGAGAIAAANGFEPAGLGSQYPLYRGDLISDDGRILRGHLSFAMHLYGSEDGTRETELYVPAGFISNSNEPTPTDAAVTFYYPKLGNLTDVTLAVFHVANFHLGYEGGRVRIGNIGGPGGSIGSYRHAHLEFYRGNTGLPSNSSRVKLRIDPVTVFESAPVRTLRSEETSARNSGK